MIRTSLMILSLEAVGLSHNSARLCTWVNHSLSDFDPCLLRVQSSITESSLFPLGFSSSLSRFQKVSNL